MSSSNELEKTQSKIMNSEFIELPETHISYFETVISTSLSINATIISAHWKKFNILLRVNNVNLGPNWCKYGITLKSNGVYKYRCAFETDSPIPQFESMIIPKGAFVKFNHIGPISKLSQTFNYIYKIAVPELSLSINPNRPILHIEKYDSKFNWNSRESIIEILLPIEGIPSVL